jgi:hypothetical protein
LTARKAFAIMSLLFGGRGRRFLFTMRIVERVESHYETQEVEVGRVYKWRPESVVIECKCGKRSTHKRSELFDSVFTCECGADHMAGTREELVVELLEEKEDEAVHPWRYQHSSEEAGIPF